MGNWLVITLPFELYHTVSKEQKEENGGRKYRIHFFLRATHFVIN